MILKKSSIYIISLWVFIFNIAHGQNSFKTYNQRINKNWFDNQEKYVDSIVKAQIEHDSIDIAIKIIHDYSLKLYTL